MIKIKVAVISDIHGNSVALKEIIKDAEKNNVEDYVYLGDLVNDLPFGNETLEIVRNTSNKVLRGNKEEYLIGYDKEKYNWTNIQFRNTVFMYNELTKENLDYLYELPRSISVEYEGFKILFVHGSPNSVEELIYQYNKKLLDKYTKTLDADALIVGHTHDKVWKEYVNGKLVLNAGCAGVSPYYKGKAEYVILEINKGKIENINIRLIDYDTELLKRKIIKSGILEKDNVLMNLTYCGLNGKGVLREEFFHEAKIQMLSKNGKWYKDDAKGIFKYFKLIDDDIWLGLANKYKTEFVFL